MAVVVSAVEQGSPAEKSGIKAGDTLLAINGEEIVDVLDYRFYQNNTRLILTFLDCNGNQKNSEIVKDEYEELGFLFDTYLMDKQHACKNKCIFCFIDQLPKGLRSSLYFKDDDSRLSFLFGNYITLTNITEHEIERIIKMHISPVNVSVHTTNPELRVKMMKNPNAGRALDIIYRLNDAGITMNCQLVLCPGYNDGEELRKTLSDLIKLSNMQCIAAVPVGLTKHREGLEHLEPFNKETASMVLDIINEYGDRCIELYGDRRIYASDEFYLISNREIPDASYYGDFMQLENGVGMWALFKSQAEDAFDYYKDEKSGENKHISVVTGYAAFNLINQIVKECEKRYPNIKCCVYPIKNNFFGEKITVTGLVTATDIIDQLSGKDLGDLLLVPENMLRREGDMFLDSITLDELSEKLNIPVLVSENDGFSFVETLIDPKER